MKNIIITGGDGFIGSHVVRLFVDKYSEYRIINVDVLDRGTAWLDTGTFASLQQAGQFVEVIEERQGLKVGCIEEIAYEQGFINADQLKQIAEPLVKSGYGTYLKKLLID